MGEYDTDSILDGKHIEMGVDRIESHALYHLQVNDIAVVHMSRDVKFTGELKFDHPLLWQQVQIFVIVIFTYS